LSIEENFSNGISFTKKEERAEKKLKQMRTELLEKDPTVMTGYYWEKMPVLMKTGIYDCLNIMPKPANLHIHLPAACPTWYMV